ncbi:hypothetical protein NBRC10512_000677 [Rhodotorula toruloides]|nr:pentatricopeptide repeat protein [Rhodotorula toruloides NP11]EMS20330.1 pentatricopeptide repeat protein [Rhodotorula toruloides NP11]
MVSPFPASTSPFREAVSPLSMLVRRCPRGVRSCQLPSTSDFAPAIAQLPAFLVPSFANAAQEGDEVRLRDAVQLAHKGRKRVAGARHPPTSFLPASPIPRLPASPAVQQLNLRRFSNAAGRRPGSVEGAGDERVGFKTRQEPLAIQSDKGKGRAHDEDGHMEDEAEPVVPPDVDEPLPPSEDDPPALRLGRRGPNPSDGYVPRKYTAAGLLPDPVDRDEMMRRLHYLKRRIDLEEFKAIRAQLGRVGLLTDPEAIGRLVKRAVECALDYEALHLVNATAARILNRDGRPADFDDSFAPIYTRALKYLNQSQRWSSAAAFSDAAAHFSLVTPDLLTLRMTALYGRQRYVDVIETYRLYCERDFDPNGVIYDTVAAAHLLNSELSAAQKLLGEKVARGFGTSFKTCLMLLEGMSHYGGNKIMEEKMLSEGGEDLLRQGRALRQDGRVLNRMLSVRASRGALRDALSLLDFYDFRGYAYELVRSIRAIAVPALPPPPPSSPYFRPTPDSSTVVALVSLLLRQQRPDLAEWLIVNAEEQKITFNDRVAAAIMRIMLTNGDIAGAEQFVWGLPEGAATFGGIAFPALSPSTAVFEVLFQGSLTHYGVDGTNKLFRQFATAYKSAPRVTEGMTLALTHYLTLEANSHVHVPAEVLLNVKDLTKGRARPRMSHVTALLKAAWKRDRAEQTTPRSANRPVEHQFPLPTLEPPAPTTEQPFPRPRPNKPPPTPQPSYIPPEAALLTQQAEEDPKSPVSRLRQSLTQDHARLTREAAQHVMSNDYLLRYIDAKWEYLQTQVLDLGMRPTFHHVAILMRAYLRVGDATGASLAMRYAIDELDVEPHTAFYTVLINGLSRLNKYEEAVAAYAEFRGSGLEPDRNLFAALAMSFALQRDIEGVERVFEEIRRHVRAKSPTSQLRTQSLRLTTSASLSSFPAAILTPYDPLLDSVFVTILYRVLSVNHRYLAAQDLVRDSLDKGMVPDTVLCKILERTRSWIRWKTNLSERLGLPGVEGGPKANGPKLTAFELDELRERNFDNLLRVRRMLKKMVPEAPPRHLRALEAFWRKAEKADSGRISWEQDEDKTEGAAASETVAWRPV